MRPTIAPLKGDFIMRSPDFTPPPRPQHHEESPADEIVDHVSMEALGLGGLALVLSVLKLKDSLMTANNPAGGGGIAIRPRSALNPAKAFKPGA